MCSRSRVSAKARSRRFFATSRAPPEAGPTLPELRLQDMGLDIYCRAIKLDRDKLVDDKTPPSSLFLAGASGLECEGLHLPEHTHVAPGMAPKQTAFNYTCAQILSVGGGPIECYIMLTLHTSIVYTCSYV